MTSIPNAVSKMPCQDPMLPHRYQPLAGGVGRSGCLSVCASPGGQGAVRRHGLDVCDIITGSSTSERKPTIITCMYGMASRVVNTQPLKDLILTLMLLVANLAKQNDARKLKND